MNGTEPEVLQHMMGLSISEWIQIGQGLILLITVFVIWHYTNETKKLRLATQEQTDLLIQPLPVLEYKEVDMSPSSGTGREIHVTRPELTIMNATDNPAINIQFDKIYLMEEDRTFIEIRGIRILHGKQNIQLNCTIVFDGDYETSSACFFEQGKSIITGYSSVAVTYYNAKMKKFVLHGLLSATDFKIQKIESVPEK